MTVKKPKVGKVYSFVGRLEGAIFCTGRVVEVIDDGHTARVELIEPSLGLDRLNRPQIGEVVKVWLDHAVFEEVR